VGSECDEVEGKEFCSIGRRPDTDGLLAVVEVEEEVLVREFLEQSDRVRRLLRDGGGVGGKSQSSKCCS
jgi:hypothetical protein